MFTILSPMGTSLLVERVAERIYTFRGHRVMLDSDLAGLYGVATKVLNQALRRNMKRFPDDFMFQLSAEEIGRLRSQIVTLKKGRGQHRKYLPFVFTEHGVLMLSNVLNSPKAIDMGIAIVRAFIQLREMLATHKELSRKFKELEEHVGHHGKQIQEIFEAIRQIMAESEKPKRQIGFRAKEGES